MANSEPSDVLIVGGGIAGLSLTLQLPGNARITLIAKAALDEGASLYAQSGIAAVLDEVRDSLAAHIEDTLRAGAGLCHRQAVEHVIRHGPDATRWLIAQGVPFSHEDGPDGAARYHLTREGAATATGASSTPRMPPAGQLLAPCKTVCAANRTLRCWRSVLPSI